MNRKKRKLQFIRKKNHVRLGGLLHLGVKTSGEIISSTIIGELEQFFEDCIVNEQKRLKLKLFISAVDIAQIDDDFTKDMYTFKITLKHV